jgi:cell division protein FtsB
VDLAPKRIVRRQIRSNAEIRRTTAFVFLVMASILFFMGMTSIFLKAGVSRLNFSINSLSAENELVLLENARTRGMIAELRSLDRIEELARRELGMIKNEQIDFMVLSSTIVAEGKMRITEEAPEEERRDERPHDTLARALDRFLSWLESR